MNSTDSNSQDSPATNQFRLKQLLLFVTVLCVVGAVFRTPFLQSLNNSGHSDWVRASPFTYVEVNEDVATVEFNDASYELVSINDVPTADILRSARRRYGWSGEKRFIEDLPEVMGGLGLSPDETSVDLVLRDAAGEEVIVKDAPMTEENRSRVYRSRRQASGTSFDYIDVLLFVLLLVLLFNSARIVRVILTIFSKRKPNQDSSTG